MMSLLVVIALIIMVIQVDAISKIHHLLLNFVQSISENEETQYPENLNNSQKARYKQKFSKDFIVEQWWITYCSKRDVDNHQDNDRCWLGSF